MNKSLDFYGAKMCYLDVYQSNTRIKQKRPKEANWLFRLNVHK